MNMKGCKASNLTSQILPLWAMKVEQCGYCMSKTIQDGFIPVCVEIVTCLKLLPQIFWKPSDLTLPVSLRKTHSQLCQEPSKDKSCRDEQKEHWSFLLFLCIQHCFSIFHINTFSISVTPLQRPLYWCTNHNQCKVRSTPVKPVTSHLQDTDNPSYCLPVCSLASLQWFVYSHSSSASEPKKTSLMQFCCNISPLPVADTTIMTTVIFLLWLRWSMLVSPELKDPETHPENLSHVSHPPL